MEEQLKAGLEAILEEKNTKLLPENIKAGVTILGVTGTYTGENSSGLAQYIYDNVTFEELTTIPGISCSTPSLNTDTTRVISLASNLKTAETSMFQFVAHGTDLEDTDIGGTFTSKMMVCADDFSSYIYLTDPSHPNGMGFSGCALYLRAEFETEQPFVGKWCYLDSPGDVSNAVEITNFSEINFGNVYDNLTKLTIYADEANRTLENIDAAIKLLEAAFNMTMTYTN